MVYVDDFKAEEGQKFMFHMVADNHKELLQMANILSIPYKFIRNEGKYNEHFYISAIKRNIALANGAKSVTIQQLVALLKERPDHPLKQLNTIL